jgi:hypothetical protein
MVSVPMLVSAAIAQTMSPAAWAAAGDRNRKVRLGYKVRGTTLIVTLGAVVRSNQATAHGSSKVQTYQLENSAVQPAPPAPPAPQPV